MSEDSILFCIPLKEGKLTVFKEFVADCLQDKLEDWKEMLARYDMSSVKVWYKEIKNRDYVFVFHHIGTEFADKIQGWNDSQHPFDRWFNEQLINCYATDATSEPATSLAQFYV